MELKIPRDRNGTYEPTIVPKYSNQINEIYGFEVSADTISKITDKIIPLTNDWQNRQLEEIYSFVFIGWIVYKVRIENVIIKVFQN